QLAKANTDRINNLVKDLCTTKEELNTANLEMENVFSSISDMLFVLDKNQKITKINNSVTVILGVETDHILSQNFLDYFKVDSPELKSFFNDDEPLNELESIINCKDNELIPVVISGVRMLNYQNGKQGFILKIIDARQSRSIKEIQCRQEQLVQHSKLGSTGQMASGIAHEINNPLTIISAKAQLINMKLEKGEIDMGYIRSSVGVINSTAHRISSIIKNLKTFSRESTNHKKDWYCLNDIVNDTLSFCNDKFKKKDIDIRVNISKDIWIFCHNEMISQVFINLLNNSFDAIQFTEEKWIKIEAESIPEINRIIFTDCGNGIAKEKIDKIFTPFFSTKEINHGTGLGLSLVRETMEFHDGSVRINSEAQNTQFILDFPISPIEI
ncbi:MAG: ATP-binding protein, partial [Crocinitomicaceae bacterium]|nr:ATP-binding protein [Crocinitomicaceae bacterium]